MTEALGSDTIARLRVAICRSGEERGGSVEPLRRPASAGDGGAGAIARYSEAHQRRGAANSASAGNTFTRLRPRARRRFRHSLESLQNVSGESGQAEVRLRELQREADANRTLYESFLGHYKEATARESFRVAGSAPRHQRRHSACSRRSPRRCCSSALAVPLGAAIGSLLAIGIDRFDGRVKTLDQIEAISGIPAVTTMPLIGLRELSRITKRGRRALSNYRPQSARMLPLPLQPPLMHYILEEPNSLFAEAVRAVRLCVQRAARVRPHANRDGDVGDRRRG